MGKEEERKISQAWGLLGLGIKMGGDSVVQDRSTTSWDPGGGGGDRCGGNLCCSQGTWALTLLLTPPCLAMSAFLGISGAPMVLREKDASQGRWQGRCGEGTLNSLPLLSQHCSSLIALWGHVRLLCKKTAHCSC